MPTRWGDTSLNNFSIHSIAEAEAGYNYYLFIHAKGMSVVLRVKDDGTEYLYADGGLSGHKWDDRAILDYKNYDKLVE